MIVNYFLKALCSKFYSEIWSNCEKNIRFKNLAQNLKIVIYNVNANSDILFSHQWNVIILNL